MIIPYTYREFEIEGFYDPVELGGEMQMAYSALASHPRLEGVYGVGACDSWGEAMQEIETLIDELVASWN